MKNDKNLNLVGELKTQLNTPKTETRIILNDWQAEVKTSKLSRAARNKVINRSGSSYLSPWADTDIGEAVGYGPVEKWCSDCKVYKDVSSSSYKCPSCGTSFGTLTRAEEKPTDVAKHNTDTAVKYGGSSTYTKTTVETPDGTKVTTESAKYEKK